MQEFDSGTNHSKQAEIRVRRKGPDKEANSQRNSQYKSSKSIKSKSGLAKLIKGLFHSENSTFCFGECRGLQNSSGDN